MQEQDIVNNCDIQMRKLKTIASIKEFVQKYDKDYYVNENDAPEGTLYNLLKAFSIQKAKQKIYVIIDEYDHFANELLSFHTENYKPNNRKI